MSFFFSFFFSLFSNWERERERERKRERIYNWVLGETVSKFTYLFQWIPVENISSCREEKNFVFWFGAQFTLTLNFTQSGWLILFTPDLHFRPPNLVSCQTQSLWLENTDLCRRHTSRSSIAMLFSWTMPPSADISLRL